MDQIILVINPGSTSTKLAVFKNEVQTHATSLHHSSDELARFAEIVDQKEYREQVTEKWLGRKAYPWNR